MSRAWASRSRQAASAASIARKRLLLVRGLSRFQAMFGIEPVKRRVLQRRHFLRHPGAAAGLFQPRLHPFIDHAQMGDVGQGIFQLALAEAGGGSSR